MKRKLAKESERHRQAFAHYCGLGKDRTYRAVAQRFAVSLITVERWGASFDWKRRLREQEKELQTAVEASDRVARAGSAVREEHILTLQCLHGLLRKTVAALVEKGVSAHEMFKLIAAETALAEAAMKVSGVAGEEAKELAKYKAKLGRQGGLGIIDDPITEVSFLWTDPFTGKPIEYPDRDHELEHKLETGNPTRE